MIISVSGKIGSGKDTVGKIIQHLTSEWAEKDFKDTDMLETRSEWQIKKYAEKLKQIACIILGCTREQLEDREFKEKELGEEWKFYRVTNQYQTFIFDNLKDASESHGGYYIGQEVKLTPRKILQLLGTEAGRQIIHPNIWVNALMSEYKESSQWIITDTRFPNELQAVKDRGGVTIKVLRPETDHLAGDHASETALDNATFDYVIVNDGSLKDLIDKVKEILLKEDII